MSGYWKVLLIVYIVGYIFNPVLLESKARLITMLLSFLLIFIFDAKFKEKLMIIIFSIIMSIVLLNSNNALSRFDDTLNLIKTGKYSADSSTSVRVAEIINISKTLHENIPYSIPLGMGPGALYYDDYAPLKGGIHKGNYRDDGGIHHIFTVYFAYIFRYGVIGLLLILLFVNSIRRKILVKNSDVRYNAFFSLMNVFIIVSLVADAFVPVHVYGNYIFGFLLSLFVILHQKLNFKSE